MRFANKSNTGIYIFALQQSVSAQHAGQQQVAGQPAGEYALADRECRGQACNRPLQRQQALSRTIGTWREGYVMHSQRKAHAAATGDASAARAPDEPPIELF